MDRSSARGDVSQPEAGPTPHCVSEHRIRCRAYALWERDGRSLTADANWFRAEAELGAGQVLFSRALVLSLMPLFSSSIDARELFSRP